MIVPPLIISEGGDLCVFETVTAAEQYLEAIDVRNGEYLGFDSEGRKLVLEVVARRQNSGGSSWLGAVESVAISAWPMEPTYDDQQELRRAIDEFFRYQLRMVVSHERPTLERMVGALVEEIGFTR